MKPRISFLTIAVNDLHRSVAFYKDGLGLPTKGILKGAEEHCLFELENDFQLVLYRRKEFMSLIPDQDKQENSAGFIISHLAESKEEVDAVLEKALNAGAKQVGQTMDESWGYSVHFRDPDGRQWEIVYMPHYK